MGKELTIKLYLTYLTVPHDRTIIPGLSALTTVVSRRLAARSATVRPVMTDRWTRPLW